MNKKRKMKTSEDSSETNEKTKKKNTESDIACLLLYGQDECGAYQVEQTEALVKVGLVLRSPWGKEKPSQSALSLRFFLLRLLLQHLHHHLLLPLLLVFRLLLLRFITCVFARGTCLRNSW